MTCYCDTDISDVIDDIVTESVPDEALVNGCCWKHICLARGLNSGQVDADTWSELCRRRGYVFGRQNPRGF